jgi:hypothetical protein
LSFSWASSLSLIVGSSGNVAARLFASARRDRTGLGTARTSNQWLAPLVLEASKFANDGRVLAVGDRDCIFATWVNADAKCVGRWIGRCDPVKIK